MPVTGKKLLNSVAKCVDDALEGLVATHSGLQLLEGQRVVKRKKLATDKVALLAGGGSGHEPFSGGYVGEGMLSVGVAGSVFASPGTSVILEGIKAALQNNTAGCLVIVYNYTGDRLTFGRAVEKAKNMGLKISMFVNGEDCALTSSDKTAGRRGLAGGKFIFKIAGAMAEDGAALEDIEDTCKQISQNLGTMGVALSSCSLPGAGPLFSVADDEIEVGLGVHGEHGVGQVKLCTAKELVRLMLDHMTKASSATRIDLKPKDSVAVILNNLGGTTKIEELIVAKELISELENREITVTRFYSGHLMTSLEMAGLSISILRLTDNPEWIPLLDAPTNAPAWPKTYYEGCKPQKHTMKSSRFPCVNTSSDSKSETLDIVGPKGRGITAMILKNISAKLLTMVEELNELDSGCGDGDCGSTLAEGARAIQDFDFSLGNPLKWLEELGLIVEKMGGTSGGVYSLLFTSASGAFKEVTEVSLATWTQALRKGLQAVMKYGGAEPGDRTMIDALYPALKVLEEASEVNLTPCLREAAITAMKGAEATKHMKARAGRASYVPEENTRDVDPGALAAATWLGEAIETFMKNN